MYLYKSILYMKSLEFRILLVFEEVFAKHLNEKFNEIFNAPTSLNER